MRNLFEHTIKPSETKPPVEKLRKAQYIVVDSQMRNKNLYSTPAKYSINLDETYRYITSVELVSCCVPTIDLVAITTGSNDTLVIDSQTVTIDSGEYTGEELADELETKINAHASLSGYTVDYDESSLKLKIGNASAFTITKAGSTCAKTIGLKRDVPSTTAVTLPYKVNIQNCPYVMLHVGQLEHVKSTSSGSSNSGIRGAFAMINIKRRFAEETVTYENTNVKHFNPVLPRLAKLDIEFKRPNNTLHDFREKEHVLTFKITTMNGNGGFGNTLG